MENYIGQYTVKNKSRYRTGITSFEVGSGVSVKITQVDNEHRKVLVDFGDGCIDWFHNSIVDNLIKC